MNPTLAPYWQTFSALWRQRKTEKAFGFLIAIAALMVVGWLVLLLSTQFDREAIGKGVGMTLVFASHVFLALYLASAMAHNQPVSVLTVPGYLKVQRRTLMATWAVAVLVQWLGLILLREYSPLIIENNALLLVICVACSLLLPLAMRFPFWIFVPMMTNFFWMPRLLALWPQALADAWLWPVWNAFDWVIAPALWGVMAWAVSVGVLRPGDAKHRASAQSRNGLQSAMRGNFWDFEARRAQRSSWWDVLPGLLAGTHWAFRRILAVAQPTPDSVLDRAELGIAPGTDWRARLVTAAVLVALGGLVMVGTMLTATSIKPSLVNPMFLIVGALAAWSPFLQWYQSMRRTHREQGLLMLVPGMPSGNDLARRMAQRVLQRAAVSWVGMALMLAIFVHLSPVRSVFIWLAWGLALASLQSLPFLVRDWAQVRPQAVPSKLLLLGGPLFAGTVPLAVAMAWSGWPPALWAVLALVAMLAHLGWRWSRLALYRQPLPLGRSAG